MEEEKAFPHLSGQKPLPICCRAHLRLLSKTGLDETGGGRAGATLPRAGWEPAGLWSKDQGLGEGAGDKPFPTNSFPAVATGR